MGFGPWQVEPYPVPVARGGKVPINEHGNVWLYEEAMMPEGCVLVPEATMKVAKKLKIDAAKAVVGWKFQRGVSYPLMARGVVVCREFAEKLRNGAIESRAKERAQAEKKYATK